MRVLWFGAYWETDALIHGFLEGAWTADAKMAGEFDGTSAAQEPEIKLEFGM